MAIIMAWHFLHSINCAYVKGIRHSNLTRTRPDIEESFNLLYRITQISCDARTHLRRRFCCVGLPPQLKYCPICTQLVNSVNIFSPEIMSSSSLSAKSASSISPSQQGLPTVAGAQHSHHNHEGTTKRGSHISAGIVPTVVSILKLFQSQDNYDGQRMNNFLNSITDDPCSRR